MAGQFDAHDLWRLDSTTILSVGTAAASSSQVFGTQTRAVQIAFAGAFGSNSFITCRIGASAVVNSSSDTILVPNWPIVFSCPPGEQASFQGGGGTLGTTYSVSVSELNN